VRQDVVNEHLCLGRVRLCVTVPQQAGCSSRPAGVVRSGMVRLRGQDTSSNSPLSVTHPGLKKMRSFFAFALPFALRLP
jgi:hypothetical protein